MNPEDTRQAYSSANPDVFFEFLSLGLSGQNEGFGTTRCFPSSDRALDWATVGDSVLEL
jgi:hypothetical protein